MSIESIERALQAGDGHQWLLSGQVPAQPRAHLLWLPALGVAARHYQPLARALASHGIATWLHEWRGHGSSSLRPSRSLDWGYRELLELDLAASLAPLPAGTVLVGGHSLGGQLACCLAGLHPQRIGGIHLVASGSPWWRAFPGPRGWLLPAVYRFLPWLARRRGTLPGRSLGFGGTEARGLIADWARVGLGNRYAAPGLDVDLEAALSGVRVEVRAVLLAGDWLAPPGSLQALLGKMDPVDSTVVMLDQDALQVRADHFAWMRQPQAVAVALADPATARKKFHKEC